MAHWVDAGQLEDRFWDQTPRTHAAVMEGCSRRDHRAIERDVILAWRIGNYSAAAQAGKLKSGQYYLDQMKSNHQSDAAVEAAATFTALAARGLVTIREVPKKEREGDGG